MWLFMAGLLLLASLPSLPKINLWLLPFILIAPPLYVLGEGFFGWLLSPEHGRAISSSSFSLLRILFALVCASVLMVFIIALQALSM